MAVQFVNNQLIWGSVQAVTKAVIGQSNSYTGDYTTYISLTDASSADGDVDLGTVDLSASNGTSTTASRFLTKDNTWAVPSYTTNTNNTYTLNSIAVTQTGGGTKMNLVEDGNTNVSSFTVKGTANEINVTATTGGDVVDSANTTVEGGIEYIDENNLTLTFTGAFSGKAYLN